MPVRARGGLRAMATLRGRLVTGAGDLHRWMQRYSDEYQAATEGTLDLKPT